MSLQHGPPGAITNIDGRDYLYFAGSGYLGLQSRPEVIAAACAAAGRYGIGSANSRTAFGTTPPLLEVERRAADMFGLDDAFYYASGWMGNGILADILCRSGVDIPYQNGADIPPYQSRADIPVCQEKPGPEGRQEGRQECLPHRQECLVLIDEHAHYSVHEAARLTGWPLVKFRHCDPDDLRAKLKERLKPGQCPLALSDGVFAATGRIAPVAEYYDVLRDYPRSSLYLDDAHAVAVLGENGRGAFEHAGLWQRGVNAVGGHDAGPYLMLSATLSKAVGGYGGIIPGCREFIGRIKSQSPYFGGASPPPTPIAAATARALELIQAEPDLRTRLRANTRLLKDGLRRLGFAVDDTPAPIVCLAVGTAENMQRIQRELMLRGVAVPYMAAYAGLGPEGGLRIAVFATHSEAMIGQLLEELRRLV